ncbi:hypothetical protein ACIBEJ_35125 [Nonomuraea sp. NPDC050790]|uniref:hypothetical protein n=1 Tax=Nonomuraea sp. NPDC050790 TaxID=3364371 RepID=UPI003796EF48
MPVSFGSASSAASNSASFNVARPTSTASGDFMIAFLANDAGGLGISGGTTWVELTAGTVDSLRYRVMYKQAGGSEPANYTVAQTNGGDCHASVIRAPGGSGTPVFAVDATGTGTSISTPSVTPDGAADLLIRFVAGYPFAAAQTWSPPASHTERTDLQSNDFTSGTTATRQLASSGATGTALFTASSSCTEAAAITVSITDALDATIDASTVDVVANIPSLALSTGSGVHAVTVDAAAEIPTPGVSAGQSVHPATVEAVAVIPSPSVTAGSTELVEPATVVAVGEVPSPSITAVQNATPSPATVEAAAVIPAPTVTATFQATIQPATVEAVGEIPSAGVSVPTLPGDNLTDVGQVELNGVVWGTGTPYRIREITGWQELPSIDDLSEEEPGRHGAYAGASLARRRIVTVALQLDSISDPTQVDDLLRQLRYDTRILRDNTLWAFVAKGYTELRLGFCKVTDRTGVMGGDYSVGAPEPVITLTFPDARLYGLDQQSQVVAANASGPTEFINAGDVYTNPVLRFPGPATNPLIVNETLDRVLAFDLTLGGSDLLVVDTHRGKAMIGSTDHGSDVSDTISVPIKEFFLDVGSNELSYETDSGGAAGVEVLHRDAYM